MPYPPEPGEKVSDYMRKCMEELKKEYPDDQKRAEVCYAVYKEGPKK
jgi:hypothetical protein